MTTKYYFKGCFLDKFHYRAIFQNLKANPYKNTNPNANPKIILFAGYLPKI